VALNAYAILTLLHSVCHVMKSPFTDASLANPGTFLGIINVFAIT